MQNYSDFDSLTLALPDEWVAMPLDAAQFDRFRAELVTKYRADPNYSKTAERKLELLMNRARGELVRQGARLVAVYFDAGLPEDAAEPATSPEDLLAMMAVATFAVYTRNDLETDLRLSVGTLFGAFAKNAHSDTKHGTVTNLEPPTLHELPCGRAVRLRRLYKQRGFGIDQHQEPFFAESYILPLGDDGEAAGVLQFATTNIDLAAPFSALFERIAATMKLLTPDQPTATNEPAGTTVGGC